MIISSNLKIKPQQYLSRLHTPRWSQFTITLNTPGFKPFRHQSLTRSNSLSILKTTFTQMITIHLLIHLGSNHSNIKDYYQKSFSRLHTPTTHTQMITIHHHLYGWVQTISHWFTSTNFLSQFHAHLAFQLLTF